MAETTRARMTAVKFDEWVLLPEHLDTDYELIDGEIYPVVSNSEASEIALTIGTYIKMYLLKNRIGTATGSDGGYIVNGERYIPDVGYISFEKRPKRTRDAYYPQAPDLAVEVISDLSNSKEQAALRLKLVNYLAEGVLVWIVDPQAKTVEVHQAGSKSRLLGVEDTLEGGAVLPAFSLAVEAIFA